MIVINIPLVVEDVDVLVVFFPHTRLLKRVAVSRTLPLLLAMKLWVI